MKMFEFRKIQYAEYRIQNTEYFIDNRNQYRSLVTRANKDYTRTRSTSKQT